MIQNLDHQIDRIRNHLPDMQEIAAAILLCCLVWGVVILIVLEALP